MTHRRIELLAPGGDVDCIKAAVLAGADAVYCGLHKFNARNRAANVTFNDLHGILRFAHQHECRVYLALNIIIVESDLPELIGLLNKLVNTSIDGVIVQDLGLFYLLSAYFPGLKVHGSTQLTTHNAGQIEFLTKLQAVRLNLSRELSIAEIGELARVGHQSDVSTEVFVHGSYCISFSGICYLSSVHGANSGNRGRCSQPCRDRYLTTGQGKDYPLNLKDNSAYDDVALLAEAGVDAVKIEGRVKESHYVYTVTNAWRRQLESTYTQDHSAQDGADLHTVFNRDFSNGYLRGDIHKSMFGDHPRNQAAKHLLERNSGSSDASFEEIARNIAAVKERIERASIKKAPMTVRVSGRSGAPLEIAVETPDATFAVLSEARLVPQRERSSAQQLTHTMFQERLKALNDTEYFIEHLELENLQRDLHLPFKEITSARERILFRLRGAKETVAPADILVPKNRGRAQAKPTLSVLISSPEDLHLGPDTAADIHFQLPSCLGGEFDALVDLFHENKGLTPWFPSILIGDDYTAAVEFLRKARPNRVVTDNTGIAHEACEAQIPWIAGPSLNTANSFSLLALQKHFECAGAFISNELSQDQIRRIKPPAGFELYYRIYHPIVLLTSRQCLFHQVTGCSKSSIDDTCVSHCERSASITNAKNVSLRIEKTPGNYASIFHDAHFLNTEIVTDVPDLFSGFMIDLRRVETETVAQMDKAGVIALFERHLRGDARAAMALQQGIGPTTCVQYTRGI